MVAVCGGVSSSAQCHLPGDWRGSPSGGCGHSLLWFSLSLNLDPPTFGIVRNLAGAKALLGSSMLAAATPTSVVPFLEVPSWPLPRAPMRVSGETPDLVH